MRLGFQTWGSCLSWAPLLAGGLGWGWLRQPVRVGLLHHPTAGNWLIDTGLHPRLWQGPLWLKALCLLGRMQIPPGPPPTPPLDGIFLSHLHVDHVAGLRDFPEVPILCSRLESPKAPGVWPGLLPHDFQQRVRWLEDFPPSPWGRDLFGDGTVQAVPLPGHTAGQHGLRVELESGPVLFAADAAGHRRILQQGRRHRLLRLIASDPRQEWATQQWLSRLLAQKDSPRLVLSHCPESCIETSDLGMTWQ